MKQLLIIMVLLLAVSAQAEFQDSEGISAVFHGTYMMVSASADKGKTWKDLPNPEYETPAIFIAKKTVVELITGTSMTVVRVAMDYSDDTGLVNVVKMSGLKPPVVGWEFRSYPSDQRYVMWIVYYSQDGKVYEGNRLLLRKLR